MIDVRFVQYVLFAVLFPFIIGLMGPHLRSYPTFGQRVFRILEGVLHVSLDETTKKRIENETHQYCITREKFCPAAQVFATLPPPAIMDYLLLPLPAIDYHSTDYAIHTSHLAQE